MQNQQKIRVAVRVRPLLDLEKKQGHSNSKIDCNGQEVIIKEERNKKSYKFDHVLPETASQDQVFKSCEIDQLVQSVIEGYHVTVFAYGQTGSGKTHTMEGQRDDEGVAIKQDGIIPKTIHSLFNRIKQNALQRDFSVYCSYLQIYNEKIYDLLGEASKVNFGIQTSGLKMRWNVRDQFVVENLFVYQCKSAEEVIKLFKLGSRNRITASHKLNFSSSRSHSIFEIKIESVDLKNPDYFITSKLELVDLAGSERISLTGTEGRQAKESIEINKSLMTLRQVIAILSDANNKTIPPYRDSKLTSLLKQSIGGNCFCLMIACIAPLDSFYDENVSTLQYATKAAYITNLPMKNDDPKLKVVNELKQQIKSLKAELSRANEHIESLSNIVQKKDNNQSLNGVQTRSNFDNLLKNQQRLLEQESSDDDVKKFDQVQQNERLIDSINMVRELLFSNKEMREREEQINQKCEAMYREIQFLQKENFELRERLGDPDSQSPQKRPSTIKKNTMMVEELGFLPEQVTQFQRNFQKDFRETQSKDYRDQQMSMTNQNIRAHSQRTQGRQLPLISNYQQNFEEVQQDEMTNFRRRSLYQKQFK
ncbi:unnamed protein product (macronuclear) [Paramecium tetraurelia]|uniref:Kinesin-like protein n=1 Tax=Paramecium tetraurelia TaxID=5888 RepID=A0EDX1_PARTE|nr:uncharacterized protein GSPATT00025832001 [Paramecium tetraurelia]CAK93488.1 unnamed protein product [Paramecium tetraurelia]|eukprot:XP_001460885.1 hypothetical protein (macronuclear) [Paramecium tetraurelia strain d4-2]